MKKALLSIAAVTLLSVQGFAQITLNNTDYGTLSGTTDILMKANANSFETTIGPLHINNPKPSGGVWDLNTVYPDTNAKVYIRHVAQTGYDYADSMTENLYMTSDTFSYEAKVLTNITAGGVIQHGLRIPRKANFIVNGGTPGTDSLVILEQDAMYYDPSFTATLAPRTDIKLPLTATTPVWSNNYMYFVKGVFTYTPDGYLDDTLERRRYIIDILEPIGYGTMKIRKHIPGTPWSDVFDVLQVRLQSVQITDSFFVNGVVATQAELDIFGFQQGQDTTFYRDYYYRAGEVVPLIDVRYTDGSRNFVMNTPSGRSLAHTQRLDPVSVNDVTLNDNFAIFPNPVKSGGSLNIDLKTADANGKWSYNLINVTGQQVTEGSLNLNGGKTNITLPKLPTGIYYIQATNGDKKIVKAMEIGE